MSRKKNTSIFDKGLHVVNSIFAFALLLSFVLPYISPETLPLLAVLSLTVPFLIISNTLFAIYWIIKFKKHWIISGIVLIVGYLVSTPFFKINNRNNSFIDEIKLMSYNVRMFNIYKHIKEEKIDQKILDFIQNKKPDVLAIQEFYKPYKKKLGYSYCYFEPKSTTKKFGLALFSKYKIINKGSLNFKNSSNNAIYIDIIKQKDTIRVYNIHLQSLKINPKEKNFGQKNSEILLKRLEDGFVKQAQQTKAIISHSNKFKGRKIICGDFNNNSYSWVYKQLSKNMKDAYIEAGSGFGKTFNYFFPMRIDFILTDMSAEINNFKTYGENYSDHYPILVRLNYN